MARGLGGVMVALAVRDGPALVRFQAKPLGDIAQLVERCPSKAKAGGSTPLIPTVVGPDIKMAPHSIGFVGSVVEHLPCKQQVVGSSPARSFESDEDSRRDCPLAQSVERETFKFEPKSGVN